VAAPSGVVLLRENGAEIDAHDAVMRINMAPVRGFETYVGSKTTFNIVNSHNVREMLQVRYSLLAPVQLGMRELETENTVATPHAARGWARPPCRPLQDPILLPPWVCFRGGGFPNLRGW
jgi:hypothetical protein